ncbi:porin [candidate division KSB1 bacterium]|nr:porin [candidate division KSB1 bacterium]
MLKKHVLWFSLMMYLLNPLVSYSQAGAQEKPEIDASAKGFKLSSADDNFQLRIRAHLQFDGRMYSSDESDAYTNSFLIRRNRLIFQGTLYKYFSFKIMPDFGGGKTELLDAYFDMNISPLVNFRFGKTKVPFGIELLQSPLDFMFIERALPNNLVPNRDIGIMLYGECLKGIADYQVSLSNGVIDGARGDGDEGDSKDLSARVVLNPFRKSDLEELKGLSAGFALTTGRREGNKTNPCLPSYKSPGQLTLFRYLSDGTDDGTAIASGDHLRYSPQMYYHYGRFGLLGEYVTSSQEITMGDNSDKLEHKAFQMAATFMLTDDDASYKTVEPKKIFDPDAGTWGAFELVGRFNELDIDDHTFPIYANPNSSISKATAWAVGLNWYLNRLVRIMVNYEHTTYVGGAVDGDRDDEDVILARFQLAY